MPLRLMIVLVFVVASCSTDATSTAPDPPTPEPAVEQQTTTTTPATTITAPPSTSPPSTAPPSTALPSTTTTTLAATNTAAAPVADCVRVADFDDTTWFIVNDGVMGGRSSADGAIDATVLRWTGTIVTAGGGFSSIRGPVDGQLENATSLTMRIQTDGRRYELLADDALPGREGRVTHYNPIDAAGGEWEEVVVPLTGMEARIFGSLVTDEPFAPAYATQIGVILADGVDGDFSFEIDWIDACP